MEVALGVAIVCQLVLISWTLLYIYWKPHPNIVVPKQDAPKVISQSVAVKTESDFTTIQPATLSAASCTHDWEVITDRLLTTPHEQVHIVIMKCDKCGSLDKTKSVTSKPPAHPAPEWKREHCKHNWNEEKAVRLESAFEQISDAGKSFDLKKIDIEELPRDFFRKAYIKTRICRTCGEINTVQASNYEVDYVPEEGS